jgi:hypothetical protein
MKFGSKAHFSGMSAVLSFGCFHHDHDDFEGKNWDLRTQTLRSVR